MTGMSTMNEVLRVKRIELLQECLPKLKSIAVMYDPGVPHTVHELAADKEAATKLGIEVVGFETIEEAAIADAFTQIARQRHDAVLITPYPLTTAKADVIAVQGLQHRLPCVGEPEQFALAGGFASYGADWTVLFHQSADHIDKILRGAKPGDLPIQAAAAFVLAINEKTAMALGVRIPPNVLVRVDRLIR
jgi:putative ABC transport system substrate-binding protein